MSTATHTDLSTQTPTIVFTRIFNAPRERVFAAWTDPKHLAQWWGPFPTATRVEVDLRVGGHFRFVMVSPDGNEYPHGGEYLEVVPPERLVFTNIVDDHIEGHGQPPQSVVTVTLQEHEGKTTMTVSSLLNSFEDRDRMLEMGAQEGWSMSFDKLDTFLEKLAS